MSAEGWRHGGSSTGTKRVERGGATYPAPAQDDVGRIVARWERKGGPSAFTRWTAEHPILGSAVAVTVTAGVLAVSGMAFDLDLLNTIPELLAASIAAFFERRRTRRALRRYDYRRRHYPVPLHPR